MVVGCTVQQRWASNSMVWSWYLWIKANCRQPEVNISCITDKVYIKPVEHLPCLTV
jgi:hypothetical protein